MVVKTNSVVMDEYDQLKDSCAAIKSRFSEVITRIDGQSLSTEFLLKVYSTAARSRTVIQGLLATPGLADYAKALENDPNYDVIAEGNALISAVTGVIAWVDNNYPSSGTYLLSVEISDGEITPRVLRVTASAAFSAQLASVVALIE